MTSHILVVEDDPSLSLLVTRLLGHHGFASTVITDGHQAAEAIEALRPDLMVLDVMLPGMSGYNVCRLVKSTPATAHIPVVMLTAKAYPLDRRHGEDAGADAYITKPFDPDALIGQIRELLPEAA